MSSEDYRRAQQNARQLQSILTRLEALERGAGLRNSAIGAGGMRVRGGGSIYLEDGGDFVVTDGGHIDVSGGGGVTIIDGGDLNVADGGEVTLTGGGLFEWQDSQGRQRFAIRQSANYPENMEVIVRDTAGLARVLLGMMYNETTGVPSGEGILVQLADGRDVLSVRPGRTVLYGDSNVTVAADDQLSLRAETGNAFLRAGGALTMSAEGSAFLTADGSASLTAGGGVSLTGENVNIRSQSDLSIGTSNDSHRLYRAGSSLYLTAPDTVGVVSADFYVWGDIGTNGDLSASGTKNFVIDHPTVPGRSLVHASTESPVAGIEYTGTATLDEDGQAVVDLPDYFEALAAPDGRTVHLTPVGRPFAVGADPVTGGAFTAYGEPGRAVSWLVKARRGDVAGQFDPEPPAPPHASPEPAPAPAAEPTVEPEPPREAPTERTT